MRNRIAFAAAALSLLAPVLPAPVACAAPGADEAEPAVFRPKPTAPIGIAWELEAPPAVGMTLRIVLTITAEIGVSGARLTLGVDDPLPLIDPAAETALGTLRPGEPVTVVVTVLPLVAETQYLRVAVGGQGSGAPQLRTLSVPIRFENARPDKNSSPLSLSPEGATESLQAVETVR